MKLNGLNIQIFCKTQPGRPTVSSFLINIDPGADLSERERKIIFNTARTCHVHRILSGEMTFDYRQSDKLSDSSSDRL